MNINYRKSASIVLSSILLFEVGGFTVNQVKAAELIGQQQQDAITQDEKVRKVIAQAILDNLDDVKDKEYANELRIHANNLKDGISTRGKVTLTAKAGAKAMKAIVQKIGQKAWDKIFDQIDKNLGVDLVWFHYKSINTTLEIIAGYEGTLTDGISKFLVNKAGFNKSFANVVARAIVFALF